MTTVIPERVADGAQGTEVCRRLAFPHPSAGHPRAPAPCTGSALRAAARAMKEPRVRPGEGLLCYSKNSPNLNQMTSHTKSLKQGIPSSRVCPDGDRPAPDASVKHPPPHSHSRTLSQSAPGHCVLGAHDICKGVLFLEYNFSSVETIN